MSRGSERDAVLVLCLYSVYEIRLCGMIVDTEAGKAAAHDRIIK